MRDLFYQVAADKLRAAGYSVYVNLANDRLFASIRGIPMVRTRIKNAQVPANLIYQAEQAADLLRKNGRLYA